MLGNAPGKTLFPAADPIGKQVRIGRTQYTVVGVFGKRPNPLGGTQADEFALIPHTTWQKVYGADALRIFGIIHRDIAMIVIPRDDVTQAAAMREVEEIMRARHGLRLDQENDFDIATQAALLQVWERISGGIFLALVVISSIALMVGGIGVMAIMTISVTERTREIGVRKALGARRREILWQFLLEAVFLTSLGGLVGIVLGASIGWLDQRPVGLSRSRCRGGRSPSASASRRRSASSSASSRPSRRPGSTRSKPCATSSRERRGSAGATNAGRWRSSRRIRHRRSAARSHAGARAAVRACRLLFAALGARLAPHRRDRRTPHVRTSQGALQQCVSSMPPPSVTSPWPAIPGPARRSSPARSSSPPAR